MTQPKSLAAYAECEAYFEQALNSGTGLAIRLETSGLATRFIQKMNTYRAMLRRNNARIYPPDHPSFGTSPYDHFKLSTDKADPTKVLIKAYKINVLGVEPLPEED